MSKRDILSICDLSAKEIRDLFESADYLKKRWQKGKYDNPLRGKTLGLIFHKPSTRTRVSFETAIIQLGGSTIFMAESEMQVSRGESIADTARVLSRYLQAVAIRTYKQETVSEFASYSSIPVINALTDRFHPCQVLSDLYTVRENKKDLDGLKIAWIGDGNNVAQSWLNAAIRFDFSLHLACPRGYEPDPEILAACQAKAENRIILTNDPREAAEDADVINTDVWVSMGQEEERASRLAAFHGFQVNKELLQYAKPDAIVLHCLPAHRGEEITADILDDPASVIFDQAENKMHVHKALLAFVMGGELE